MILPSFILTCVFAVRVPLSLNQTELKCSVRTLHSRSRALKGCEGGSLAFWEVLNPQKGCEINRKGPQGWIKQAVDVP